MYPLHYMNGQSYFKSKTCKEITCSDDGNTIEVKAGDKTMSCTEGQTIEIKDDMWVWMRLMMTCKNIKDYCNGIQHGYQKCPNDCSGKGYCGGRGLCDCLNKANNSTDCSQ